VLSVRVVVVDMGLGNLRSVERALARAADDRAVPVVVRRSSDPDAIATADKVVVPGQGAFRDAAAALERGIGDALREQITRGAPYFGICLGLQALFERSEEAEGARGLGVFPGAVVRLPGGARDAETGSAVKIPHVGWNRIALSHASAGPLAIFDGRPPFMYFVHSFHAVPDDPSIIAAVAEHGPHRITAAIHQGHVTATQFHPEKSQRAGLELLGEFLAS
jgi:glutamine amidotransferase